MSPQNEARKELVITREFNAPRNLVFKAWTQRQHLEKWWGPKGFELFACKLDLRPGGFFHYGMRAPNGMTMWGKWIFREIVEPDRLVFVSVFSDAESRIAPCPFFEVWPRETLSTVTFAEKEGKTTVTMRGVPINANDAEHAAFVSMFDSMNGGWNGTLDQLDAYLPNAK